MVGGYVRSKVGEGSASEGDVVYLARTIDHKSFTTTAQKSSMFSITYSLVVRYKENQNILIKF